MTGFRWTLDDLRKAERAFHRHRAAVDEGVVATIASSGPPGCARGCATCHIKCSVIVGAIETIKAGLAAQARQGNPAWEMRHAGHAFSQTAGRA